MNPGADNPNVIWVYMPGGVYIPLQVQPLVPEPEPDVAEELNGIVNVFDRIERERKAREEKDFDTLRFS